MPPSAWRTADSRIDASLSRAERIFADRRPAEPGGARIPGKTPPPARGAVFPRQDPLVSWISRLSPERRPAGLGGEAFSKNRPWTGHEGVFLEKELLPLSIRRLSRDRRPDTVGPRLLSPKRPPCPDSDTPFPGATRDAILSCGLFKMLEMPKKGNLDHRSSPAQVPSTGGVSPLITPYRELTATVMRGPEDSENVTKIHC